MASSPSTKVLCSTCGNKSVGVFKCEGCLQVFCRKHSNEHRDLLVHQLDEIIVEHDTLQQAILESRETQSDHYRLIEQVNEWEKDSFMKIQRTAIETRQQIENLIVLQSEKISSKLRHLAEQLRKAREDDDFVETDLRQWIKKVQELKTDVADIPPKITIQDDPFIMLVAKLTITPIIQRSEEGERLQGICGSVRIDANGSVAIQRDSTAISYVRGKNEYSFGAYKIRFNINKTELCFSTFFGIISKTDTLLEWPSSCYGWSNDDTYYRNGKYYSNDTSSMENDLRGQTYFTIELLLDCDNRKIQYFNKQTQNMRELNIDIEKCPFPWKIFFYLHQAGDRIQLL